MRDLDNVAGYKDIVTGSREEAPASDGTTTIPATSAPELRTLVGIAVGTLVIAALYFGQEVLIPITLAVMLSFVLSPVVNLLQKLRLWRAPAVKVQFVLDALVGLIGIAQNDVFKVLTIVSIVGIAPTLLAGIYGMNFKNMPEYNWTYGYEYGLAVIFLSGLIPLIWFKAKGWF